MMLSVHTSPLAPLGGKKTGGMNVYVRELASELGQQGIAVDIFTRRTSPTQPEIDCSLGNRVRVIHVSAGGNQSLGPDELFPHLSEFTAGVIAFATRQNTSYDVTYAHYWLSGWVANKLKEVWGIPFAIMFHTLGHMKNRILPGYTPTITSDLRIGIETQIVQWADTIIAATPAEQAQLLWLYRADRRKITIVPPGVNVNHFQPVSQDIAKKQLGIPQDTQLLLFVGRIEPLKAVDTVLEALAFIRHQSVDLLQNLRFAIIGGDPQDTTDAELSRLKMLSEELHLNCIVSFLGAKDQALLPYYYSAAVAVIMPSDYESFGMVALEAMASGTPVIASQVGGLAFLVRDRQTGFLVPAREPQALAECITTLLA
ncbi:MAG: glycosyltransferase, partial [Anaerolineae bacterium]|nr:glycosyltransferase [Anaerolineae bacterium]